MNNPNNWPDSDKPGVPLNPERDGWHWVCSAVGIAAPYPMLWGADSKAWDTGDGWEFCTSPRMTERTRYLGPCLTPAEVAAREQAAYKQGWSDREDDLLAGHQRIGTLDAMLAQARREGMKEAAQEVDCGCAARQDVLRALADVGERRARAMCLHGDVCCALQAATIRAAAKEVG